MQTNYISGFVRINWNITKQPKSGVIKLHLQLLTNLTSHVFETLYKANNISSMFCFRWFHRFFYQLGYFMFFFWLSHLNN